jgi:hypothetical protein
MIPDCPYSPDPITDQTGNRYESRDRQDIGREAGGVHCSYYSKTHLLLLLSLQISTRNSVPEAETKLIPISTLSSSSPIYDSQKNFKPPVSILL